MFGGSAFVVGYRVDSAVEIYLNALRKTKNEAKGRELEV